MDIKKQFLSLLAITVITSGCSPSVTDMKCSDKIITDTVIDISSDSLGKTIFQAYIMRNSNNITHLTAIKDKSYDEILTLTKENPIDVFNEAVKVSEKVLSSLHLEDIRSQGVDAASQKLSCVANLVAEGKAEIDYTAQLTESGDVYVEVFGLE